MKPIRHTLTSLAPLALCIVLLWSLPALGEELQVINHVFSTDVVANPDGSLVPKDTIVGFQRGTASFHTITHVVLGKGTHTVTVSLIDPKGQTIASRRLPNVVSKESQWIEAVWVKWTGIPFTESGQHRFIIRVDDEKDATFLFMVY